MSSTMGATLICCVYGDPSPFPIDIDQNKTIGHLKQAIVIHDLNLFTGVAVRQLEICAANIPDTKEARNEFIFKDDDALPVSDTIQDVIDDHFKGSLPRKTIHFVIKRPTLQEDHRFDLIVEPERYLSLSWTVNINIATLNELKEKITKEYYPHLDSTLLKLILKPENSKPFSPDSDKDLQVLLRELVQAHEKVLVIAVATPQKPFSEWSPSAVKELYGITGEFPEYECGRAPLVNTRTLPSLLDILNEFSIITPIYHLSTEATASLYVHSILNKVAADFLSANPSSAPFELGPDRLKPIFIIKPQKQVTGVYGKGPVDYAIDGSNGVTVSVREIKREDNAINKCLAQNAVQIESALWESRKRKRDTSNLDGTDNDEVPIYSFGIVTNANVWYFLKCTFVNGRTTFMVSRPYTVMRESTKDNIEILAEMIKWLLMEAQSSTTDARKKAKVMPRSD